MNCAKARSLLHRFYDGELNAADRQWVAGHLESCPACAADLAALTELDGVCRQLVSPEPPADLWDRIAARMAAPNAGKPVPKRTVVRRRFLAAAGALAASVLAGVVGYRATRRPGSGGAQDGPRSDPVTAGGSVRADPVLANLASLSPEDRRLALSQGFCAADGCETRLGAGGPPLKAVLQEEPVFLCCEACERWARAHPAEAVARLHTLELRHDTPEKKP
jgi:hypothetical protein